MDSRIFFKSIFLRYDDEDDDDVDDDSARGGGGDDGNRRSTTTTRRRIIWRLNKTFTSFWNTVLFCFVLVQGV